MDEVEVECKSGIYPNLDDIVVEDGPTLLLPCIMCNKTFIPEVLQRHSKVCEKANKKRKTFDSFKQRVQGTDLAEFLPYTTLQKRASISEKPTSPQKTSSRWKENHEAFVSAIRAARGEEQDAQGGSGDSRSLLRPPDQCPYCERHFGKKAFDRHQEWCREQHSRQPPVIASSQAKERLEARIKYRAPPLKSKRSITREKYSPLVQRKVRQASPSSHSTFSGHSTAGSATSSAGSSRHTAQSQQEQSNRLTKSGNTLSGKPQPKESQSGLGFNRGMAGRTSLRASQRGTAQRSSSPTKRTPGINTSKVTASPSQRPSKADSPPRIFDKEDMTIISSGLKKSLNKRQSTKQMDGKEIDRQDSKAEKKSSHMANTQAMHNEVNAKESKENVNNRKSSKNEHMWSGSQHQEAYDPYASAERQMMELLRSDSACNIKKQKSPSPAPSISPMPSPTLSPKPSSLETSPTSAFTRYAKELEFPVQIGNEQGSVGKRKFSGNCDKEKDASIQASLSNSSVNHVHSAPQTEVPAKNKTAEPALPPPAQPQPPPRSNRRLASLPYSRNMENLVVCGISTSQLQQQSDDSLDAVLKEFNNAAGSDLDNRPKTYDLDSHSQKESWEKGGWLVVGEQSSQRDVELPTIIDSGDGGKIEILNLENRGEKMERRETRESREIREITEQEPTISNIDNLLEEVVRMQRSVSMLSEIDPVTSKVTSQSSARSRRNRAGKMLIEDFLFPAELLVERENNNFRSTVDSSDRSNSVFGSTKSRKSSSKGRRLIEDMLFPAGTDFNANSDHNEDADVVVSANALAVTYTSPHSFNSKLDSLICPTSPVALTSQAPNTADGDDGLPRPKPMSLSAHSTARNGCKETNERERGPHSHSGPNQGRQSTSSRLSADSAYSSLNRRSPVAQVRRQGSAGAPDIPRHGAESPQSMLSQSLTQSLVLSSSGSESSLPPLSVSQQLKRGGARVKNECDTPSSDIISATTPLLPKLSKFCHHCGTKFLISVAKFCHECGAARLEIC